MVEWRSRIWDLISPPLIPFPFGIVSSFFHDHFLLVKAEAEHTVASHKEIHQVSPPHEFLMSLFSGFFKLELGQSLSNRFQFSFRHWIEALSPS